MEELIYIGEYYKILLVFILTVIGFTFLMYTSKNTVQRILFPAMVISMVLYSGLYIGNRDLGIGVDTKNYFSTFSLFQSSKGFEFRKDFLFDFLIYSFSKSNNFSFFLIFCALVYVVLASISFHKIFKGVMVYALILFLISPNFFQFGINVVRSGMAASIFLMGLGLYFQKRKAIVYYVVMVLSTLIHLSMLLPLAIFILVKYLRNTTTLIIIWLGSIMLSIMKISFIENLVANLGFLTNRFGSYVVSSEEGTRDNIWLNFLIYGSSPVLVGLYFKYVNKVNDPFYNRLLNSYILLSSVYILLIKIPFAVRIAYLSEFMMPILLIYPFVYYNKTPYKYLKLSVAFLVIFLLKAYKILSL